MVVIRVGEEVEAERATGAAHVVTEIAQMMIEEMATTTEAVAALAHDLDLRTDTTDLEEVIDVIGTREKAARVEIVVLETMTAAGVAAQRPTSQVVRAPLL